MFVNGESSALLLLSLSGRPAKMTARAQRRMLSEVNKNPSVSAKDIQKSLQHANISVDKSTTRKTLNKNGVHGRSPRKKPLLSKKKLKFTKEHLDVPQRYWQNILWTDETTVDLFGRNTQHCVEKKGTAHHQHLIPTVKYGGGSIMDGAA